MSEAGPSSAANPSGEASRSGETSLCVAPSTRTRLRAAAAIGLASGVLAWVFMAHARAEPDFLVWWTAARDLLAGGNPYRAVPGTPAWPFEDPLFYPLPAVLATVPVCWLPMPIAGALVMAGSGAALAWCATRDGLHRLWLFASGSYVMALELGQWSPLLLTAAFVPAAGWVATLKPSLGLAVIAYRPTWRGIAAAAGVVLASFLVLPSWALDWRANLSHLHHAVPVATTLGPLLLLALLRWRRPEARLLLVMACVPQLLFFADQLPLWLVARSRRETAVLSLLSLAALAAWWLAVEAGDRHVVRAAPYVLASIYLPALIFVLRSPARAAAAIPAAP